ncbi:MULTISPECIES: hypothetical protein [Pseudomonas]|uniref:Uncharacterized protein n=1 Tax=Pseudomonas lactis TaxID=1615674 RepID=A0ABS9FR51_9PSED|nr:MULTISPECIES: hypothetical protein [Pseudomonas]MBI6976437.1 hypothetical protein [Pseudomonas lactis]MCF4972068.1 hypothetical protein [Pseudomonas lactis]MCF5002449.1 hypothetical protein [Pseudomonas lactis]MCF5010177.1 hypothetical protein [Pseudomonas lactis]MCF5013487.1 hypothetical protein [Pseudomonas lactis]
MLEQIQSFSNSSSAIVTALAGVVVILITALVKALEFYDSHFVHKRYKRLKELRSDLVVESPFTTYLDDAIQLEGFHIASGIRASSVKAAALLKLAQLGLWDRKQIRQVAKYLVITPENPTPFIRIRHSDVIGAWAGMLVAMIFMAVGAILGIAVMLKAGPPYGFFIGLCLVFTFTCGSALFATGYNEYKNAKRFEQYLSAHPETFLPPQNRESTAE